jgi:hypothetical protein
MKIPQTLDAWEYKYTPDWRFDTDNFSVIFYADDEDMAPEDDGTWFCAVVAVYGPDEKLLAYDTLGGCSYDSVREFYTSHRDRDPMNRNCSIMRAAHGQNVSICHYFPDMVRTAVREAKHKIELARAGAPT